MPAARVPGPDCGHSRGSPGHRAHGASPAKHAQKPQPTAQVVGVQVVGSSFRKEITFDRPISSVEASNALFNDAQHARMLHPADGSEASRTFILSMPDLATAYSLPNAVRNAILLGSVLQSTATPWDFPAWVPDGVRDDAKQGKITETVTHYPSPQADWGDIVVWKGEADFQIYQEFPDDIRFYERLLGDSRKARLVRFAYTQYNQEMRDLVEGKGMSPEDARSEIRRINEEIFKLILEGAIAILASGVGISQVNNAIRANAEQVGRAVRRSPRFIESEENELEEAADSKIRTFKKNPQWSPDDAQLGKKFGEHWNKSKPGYRNPQEYRQLAKDVYHDPQSVRTTFPNDAPKYRGETHIQRGDDLLRLDSDGNFRTLYPASNGEE